MRTLYMILTAVLVASNASANELEVFAPVAVRAGGEITEPSCRTDGSPAVAVSLDDGASRVARDMEWVNLRAWAKLFREPAGSSLVSGEVVDGLIAALAPLPHLSPAEKRETVLGSMVGDQRMRSGWRIVIEAQRADTPGLWFPLDSTAPLTATVHVSCRYTS